MRTFVELFAKGNRRIIIDTSAILGTITAPNRTKDDVGTAEFPVTLILRNAHPIELVGIEPTMVFAAMTKIAEKVDILKEAGKDRPIAIQWLEAVDAD